MRFIPLELEGPFLVEMEPVTDDRGFNARAWCRRVMAEQGLNAQIEQIKVSNVSLMPEGVEKDVTPQQMADLLEYLKTSR